MKIALKEITVEKLTDGFADNAEQGVVAYGGKLDIRPPYQREFIYKDKQRDAVTDSVRKDFPLSISMSQPALRAIRLSASTNWRRCVSDNPARTTTGTSARPSCRAAAKRDKGVTLDRNGFNRERMMRVLVGMRHGEPMPPILVWPAETGRWRFELRDGFHRFYAARTLKFSHVPADIIERY